MRFEIIVVVISLYWLQLTSCGFVHQHQQPVANNNNVYQIEENRPKRTIILGAIFKKLLWAKLSQFNNLPITRKPDPVNATTPMPPAPMEVMMAPTQKAMPSMPPPPPPPAPSPTTATGPSAGNGWVKTPTTNNQVAQPNIGPIYYDYNAQEVQSLPGREFSIIYPGDSAYNSGASGSYLQQPTNSYSDFGPKTNYNNGFTNQIEPNRQHTNYQNGYYEPQQFAPVGGPPQSHHQQLINFPHHHHQQQQQQQQQQDGRVAEQQYQQLEPVPNRLAHSAGNYANLSPAPNNYHHQQQFYGNSANGGSDYNNGGNSNDDSYQLASAGGGSDHHYNSRQQTFKQNLYPNYNQYY